MNNNEQQRSSKISDDACRLYSIIFKHFRSTIDREVLLGYWSTIEYPSDYLLNITDTDGSLDINAVQEDINRFLDDPHYWS